MCIRDRARHDEADDLAPEASGRGRYRGRYRPIAPFQKRFPIDGGCRAPNLSGHVAAAAHLAGNQPLRFEEFVGCGNSGSIQSKPVSYTHLDVYKRQHDLFPLEDFRASCTAVLGRPDLAAILQLGSPSGYEPLRLSLIHI